MLDSKAISSKEIVEETYKLIDGNADLNAFITLNKEAAIAKSIEKANTDNSLNYSVKVSSDVMDIKKSDKIVLPGQGSFKACYT